MRKTLGLVCSLCLHVLALVPACYLKATKCGAGFGIALLTRGSPNRVLR